MRPKISASTEYFQPVAYLEGVNARFCKDMRRKLILFPGMTPSRRIFQKLAPQLESSEVIDWIAPVRAKTIAEYAVELVAEFGIDATCDLVGTTFSRGIALTLRMQFSRRI